MLLIVILIVVLLLGGVGYGFFNYTKTSSSQQMIAGDIYFAFIEGDGEILLNNAFPETKEEARSRNDNYITFSIVGKNTSIKKIYYEFILDHGTKQSGNKSRYNDEDLRFDLVEIDSNGNDIKYLLNCASYDTLIQKRIFIDTIDSIVVIEGIK